MQCILGSKIGKFTIVKFDHSSIDHSSSEEQNSSSFSLNILFNNHKKSNFVVALKVKSV